MANAQQIRTRECKIQEIASKRQLFIDDGLASSFTGEAELRLHHPIPKEIGITSNQPWEGRYSNYSSIFKDGDIYRVYFRG